MTTEQYLEALARLGLAKMAIRTQTVLGLSRSQLERLANGKSKPTEMLEMLLLMYQLHGLPDIGATYPGRGRPPLHPKRPPRVRPR
jgi:hypothetical protein